LAPDATASAADAPSARPKAEDASLPDAPSEVDAAPPPVPDAALPADGPLPIDATLPVDAVAATDARPMDPPLSHDALLPLDAPLAFDAPEFDANQDVDAQRQPDAAPDPDPGVPTCDVEVQTVDPFPVGGAELGDSS
jgi:hypothetical protein